MLIKCHKNKAFTLIELLAVIVILSIIALISMPIVLNIIEAARKSAFIDTAYGLIETAKLAYVEEFANDKLVTKIYEYPFEELKFSGSKPDGGMIRTDELGNVEIAIHNNRWCAIKNKGDSKVTLIKYEEGTCIIKDSAKDPVILLNGEKEITLEQGETYNELGASSKTVDGETLEYQMEITLDGNKVESVNTNIAGIYQIIYQVESNGKKAMVIRIVNVKVSRTIEAVIKNSSDIRTNDPDKNLRYVGVDPTNYVIFNNELWRIIGVFDGQAKIIQNRYYNAGIAWNSNGVNDWSSATLQVELNTTFLDSIEEKSKSYIDTNHIWKLGGIAYADVTKWTRSNMYEKERGTDVYKGRPTEWTGAIGLMYPSDFGYATSSTETYCEESMYNWTNSDKTDCRNKDWLYDALQYQWTLMGTSDERDGAYRVYSAAGTIDSCYVYRMFPVIKPALYLKREIQIKSGEGTKENPFILSEK